MRKSKLKVLIQKEGTKVRFRGSSGGLSGTAVKNCGVFICFSTETMSVATRLIRCRRLLMIQTLTDLRQNHKPSTSFCCLSRLFFGLWKVSFKGLEPSLKNESYCEISCPFIAGTASRSYCEISCPFISGTASRRMKGWML